MTVLHLTRTDLTKNMARYYRLDVQPDLFGGWSLWREWGRMGHSGTVRLDPYPDQGAAETARVRLAEAKARRGYVACPGSMQMQGLPGDTQPT